MTGAIEQDTAADEAATFMGLALDVRRAMWKVAMTVPVEAAKPAPKPRCKHGTRHPHECRECVAEAAALPDEWFSAAIQREGETVRAKPAPEAPSYELSSKETGALNRALLRSVKFKPAPEAVEPLRAALDLLGTYLQNNMSGTPGPQWAAYGEAMDALAALSHSAPETAPVEAK